MRLEGKDYIIHDGDVVYFRSAVETAPTYVTQVGAIEIVR